MRRTPGRRCTAAAILPREGREVPDTTHNSDGGRKRLRRTSAVKPKVGHSLAAAGQRLTSAVNRLARSATAAGPVPGHRLDWPEGSCKGRDGSHSLGVKVSRGCGRWTRAPSLQVFASFLISFRFGLARIWRAVSAACIQVIPLGAHKLSPSMSRSAHTPVHGRLLLQSTARHVCRLNPFSSRKAAPPAPRAGASREQHRSGTGCRLQICNGHFVNSAEFIRVMMLTISDDS